MNNIKFFDINDEEIKTNDTIKLIIKEIIKDHKYILANINIIKRSDEALLEMNKVHLNHDYYTDIITFELSEKDKEINAELYISVDRVQDNANTIRVSKEDELNRIIIHGVLHLVGYKDKTKGDKVLMTKMENKYLLLV